MVVDDSVVIRGMISRWIGAEPDMMVAASLRTGLDAVNQLERINPDVAVDRKSTRLNSSHHTTSRMPSSA